MWPWHLAGGWFLSRLSLSKTTMYIPHFLLAPIAVPLLGFAAGLYWDVRKGRTLGEAAQVGCAVSMLTLLLTIVVCAWLAKRYPWWIVP